MLKRFKGKSLVCSSGQSAPQYGRAASRYPEPPASLSSGPALRREVREERVPEIAHTLARPVTSQISALRHAPDGSGAVEGDAGAVGGDVPSGRAERRPVVTSH